jgi:LuxR family maltose regulon positive regulatory protein
VLCHTIGLIDEGRIALLGQWLDLLGPEMATSHPSAVVAAAWHAVGTTDPTRISRAFSAGDRLSHQGPLADGSPSLEVAMAAVRAIVAAEGTAGVLRDTEIVRAAGGPRTNPWWGFATALQGSVASFSGDNELARRLLVAGIAECGGSVSFEAGFLGVLALVEVDDGDLAGAERHVERAMALCEDHNLEGVVLDIPAYAAAALVAARRGRAEEARTASLRTRRLLVRLGDLSPRSALRGYVALAQAELALGAHVAAREMVAEADRARRMEGECAHLNDQLDRLADALDAAATPLGLAVTPITAAELRVLTYLPTHLTLQEIADATHLSRNTVKSHAVAIYRKLDASSRAEAVAAAREGGLLEAMGATERDHVTRIG